MGPEECAGGAGGVHVARVVGRGIALWADRVVGWWGRSRTLEPQRNNSHDEGMTGLDAENKSKCAWAPPDTHDLGETDRAPTARGGQGPVNTAKSRRRVGGVNDLRFPCSWARWKALDMYYPSALSARGYIASSVICCPTGSTDRASPTWGPWCLAWI
jgi:hypothetical protein